MNKRYDVLEVCLNEIEQGSGIDAVLSRYPEHADELHPIIEASVQAKDMAVPAPSQEIVKRNRAKLLQYTAELRETQATGWTWSLPLQRAFVSLVILFIFLFSGTSLVRAASASLPGDGLYPVKRAWERVLVFTTFNAQERDAMQLEHGNERLDEINEILLLGRSTHVDFSGYVTLQNGDEWRVSGVTVFISSRTDLPDQPIQTGMAVHVTGQTQNGGGVAADRIVILPPDSKLPRIEDENEQDENEIPDVEATPTVDEEAGSSSSGDPIPLPEIDPKEETIDGIVKVLQNDYMVINGVIIDMHFAEINGYPRVGVFAEAEGYYDIDGIFLALKIEFIGAGSNGGNNPANNNTNTNNNGNDNDDKDNSDNDNHNDNDNNSNEPDDD